MYEIKIVFQMNFIFILFFFTLKKVIMDKQLFHQEL